MSAAARVRITHGCWTGCTGTILERGGSVAVDGKRVRIDPRWIRVQLDPEYRSSPDDKLIGCWWETMMESIDARGE